MDDREKKIVAEEGENNNAEKVVAKRAQQDDARREHQKLFDASKTPKWWDDERNIFHIFTVTKTAFFYTISKAENLFVPTNRLGWGDHENV